MHTLFLIHYLLLIGLGVVGIVMWSGFGGRRRW